MFTRIKNFFHITVLMNLYSFRNFLTGNGAVWLKLNTLEKKQFLNSVKAVKDLTGLAEILIKKNK